MTTNRMQRLAISIFHLLLAVSGIYLALGGMGALLWWVWLRG